MRDCAGGRACGFVACEKWGSTTVQFAHPWHVDSPERCFFYHKTTLPGLGEVGGSWDLRDCIDAYLGNIDFSGKRVLDVGAASGFLTFSMEQRGADVVSYDLDDGANWDIVPHYRLSIEEMAKEKAVHSDALLRLKRAYWLAHRLHGSKAKAFYGPVYDMPEQLGAFDIVMYGMIITHLRDPFQGLYMGARLCRDTLVVSSMFPEHDASIATWLPQPNNTDSIHMTGWWTPSIALVKQWLGVLGFDVVKIVESYPQVQASDFNGGKRKCQTLVARRKSR